MAAQVTRASLIGWVGVGLITLVGVAITDRPVGSAFGIALLLGIALVLAGGAASALLQEPPAASHGLDWLLGPEPADDRASGEEREAEGLTPLGVALAIAVEMGVVLVVRNVG